MLLGSLHFDPQTPVASPFGHARRGSRLAHLLATSVELLSHVQADGPVHGGTGLHLERHHHDG